jgi:hypothetical protein
MRHQAKDRPDIVGRLLGVAIGESRFGDAGGPRDAKQELFR